ASGYEPAPGRAAVPIGNIQAFATYTPLAARRARARTRSIIALLLLDHPEPREDLGVVLVLLPEIRLELVPRAVVDVDHPLLDDADELGIFHRRSNGVVDVLEHGPGRPLGRHDHERGGGGRVPAELLRGRRVRERLVTLGLEGQQHAKLLALHQRLHLARLGGDALDVPAQQRGARLAPARERDMGEIDAGHALELLQVEMARGALARLGGDALDVPAQQRGARLAPARERDMGEIDAGHALELLQVEMARGALA